MASTAVLVDSIVALVGLATAPDSIVAMVVVLARRSIAPTPMLDLFTTQVVLSTAVGFVAAAVIN